MSWLVSSRVARDALPLTYLLTCSFIDQWNFVLSPENGSQDASGNYCRTWLPELSRLSTKHLHQPWKAPADVLAQAGVCLGESYPHRIVSDLPAARRVTVQALLATRAAALDFNDPGGYDLVTVDGTRTRVFTKQEFRLDANGQPKGDGGGAAGGAPAGGRGSRRGGGAATGRSSRVRVRGGAVRRFEIR